MASDATCQACGCCTWERCGQACHLRDDCNAAEDEIAALCAELAAAQAREQALREALLENAEHTYKDGRQPCWCPWEPYEDSRGHAYWCIQARAALAGGRGGA